jgi:hypothetical protein
LFCDNQNRFLTILLALTATTAILTGCTKAVTTSVASDPITNVVTGNDPTQSKGNGSSGPYPALFGIGPDNNQSVLLNVIGSARSRLRINIYELRHPKIVDARGSTSRFSWKGNPLAT